MRVRATLALATLALVLPAGAQTYLTPFAGAAFSGSADDSKLTFGGDLAFTGGGPLGFSLDFGYTWALGPRFASRVAMSSACSSSVARMPSSIDRVVGSKPPM